MDHTIKIKLKKEEHRFEVVDYLHHDNDRCKYKVFENGKLVVTFEPGPEHVVHVCRNPGNLANDLVHELAVQIEAQMPHPGAKHFNGQ